MEPMTAIKRVREVRPGAIQTRQQEEYVLSICPPQAEGCSATRKPGY
jgi:hypothetical protein